MWSWFMLSCSIFVIQYHLAESVPVVSDTTMANSLLNCSAMQNQFLEEIFGLNLHSDIHHGMKASWNLWDCSTDLIILDYCFWCWDWRDNSLKWESLFMPVITHGYLGLNISTNAKAANYFNNGLSLDLSSLIFLPYYHIFHDFGH